MRSYRSGGKSTNGLLQPWRSDCNRSKMALERTEVTSKAMNTGTLHMSSSQLSTTVPRVQGLLSGSALRLITMVKKRRREMSEPYTGEPTFCYHHKWLRCDLNFGLFGKKDKYPKIECPKHLLLTETHGDSGGVPFIQIWQPNVETCKFMSLISVQMPFEHFSHFFCKDVFEIAKVFDMVQSYVKIVEKGGGFKW